MQSITKLLKTYANERSLKAHIVMVVISSIVFVSVIVFGFVPLNARLDNLGGTTTDIQEASSRAEASRIISSWGPEGVKSANLLTFLDFIFIIAGFTLFISLNSLLYRGLNGKRYSVIPIFGMILTIISRSLDGFEDIWSLYIYNNPLDYPTYLLAILKLTSKIKWIVVGIEYSVLVIGFVIWLIQKLKSPEKM